MARTEQAGEDFNELLLMLRETRGFDFTGYKRSTLQRWVAHRMSVVDVVTLGEYRDYLELEPDEFGQLFDGMLVSSTSFFRDPSAWHALREAVLPELLSGKNGMSPIRVWNAGCATGEETYTLVMVLADTLGIDQFRERVKIYATDLDEDALRQARVGTYDARALADVPEPFRETYFEPEAHGTKLAFRRGLRRQVVFGRNDLTRDAPISRVDLLIARNTLMYFNAEAQADVIRRFHFALSYPGFLFLGQAETPVNHVDRFIPVDLDKRIFRKAWLSAVEPAVIGGYTDTAGRESARGRMAGAALSSGPVVQLAVDLSGKLRVANAAAELLFNLGPGDLGRPFKDLDVSYRPIELRSRIEQARNELRPVELHDVEWRRPGGTELSYYDVRVVPLFPSPGDLAGVSISFVDVTRYRRVRDELAQAKTKLESAYEDLQSTNEVLESTNEELQSTSEELQSTNEELQSTNEELETINEELQSTNDELQTINEDMRGRTEELDQANSFMGQVLRSLGSAVIVLDADLRVQVWSPGAEDLWGLRPEEAQLRELLSLDIGWPADEIAPALQQALSGAATDGAAGVADAPARQLTAVNRRGKTVELRIAAAPIRADGEDVSGVILMIDQR